MPRTYVYTSFGGPEFQRFLDLPRPVPGEGQVLVRVRAAGVNPADWKRRINRRGLPEPLEAQAPMGLEVAGVVEEVGAGVDKFAVGDELFGSVSGNGGFSEYSLVTAAFAARKPAGLSFVDAATLTVAAATGYDGVMQLKLRPGEAFLIIGIGGGVGIAAAQVAVSQGARVIGTGSASKREIVEAVGATHVVYGEGVRERVQTAAPNGIDAIYDMVGNGALRELGDLVAEGSRVISATDGATAEEFGGGRVERPGGAASLEVVGGLAATGKLKPFVTAIFPLDRVDEALALVESGHATGKVVVEVS